MVVCAPWKMLCVGWLERVVPMSSRRDCVGFRPGQAHVRVLSGVFDLAPCYGEAK